MKAAATISALWYLQYHSVRNKLISRFKRLKQPKYLAGAIVGALYFYWYFYRQLFLAGKGWNAGTMSPDQRLMVELLGAAALFVIVVVAWVVPHERAALTFSEAEVAFLFPAPVGRRGLIHFKLARSQIRILFTTLFLALVTSRRGNAWIHAAGWWVILSTLNLHFLGSSFARTLLLDRGISNLWRRLLVLLLAAVALVSVAMWGWRSLPAWTEADMTSLKAFSDYVARLLGSGPALYLLYPFRLVVRPFLASNAAAFIIATGPALGLIVLHYIWVVRSNVGFEEASVEASQKLAARIADVRAGRLNPGTKRKRKRPLFKLRPVGPRATALLWKNLISAGQAFTWRLWLIMAFICSVMFFSFGAAEHGTELLTGLAIFMGCLIGWSLILGPQLVRQDLRQDLPQVDILKLYPMPGWQVVLGEMLAPVAILTIVQWLLLLFGLVMLLHSRGFQDGTLPVVVVFGAAILLPVLDFILLLIPNSAVLIFPSWIQTGKEGPRGIEATGQRLILMLGQLVVFCVTLIPAAGVGAVAFFVVHYMGFTSLAALLAATSGAVVLAAEVGCGLFLLGRVFERFDLSAELGP